MAPESNRTDKYGLAPEYHTDPSSIITRCAMDDAENHLFNLKLQHGSPHAPLAEPVQIPQRVFQRYIQSANTLFKAQHHRDMTKQEKDLYQEIFFNKIIESSRPAEV